MSGKAYIVVDEEETVLRAAQIALGGAFDTTTLSDGRVLVEGTPEACAAIQKHYEQST